MRWLAFGLVLLVALLAALLLASRPDCDGVMVDPPLPGDECYGRLER